MEKEIKIGLIKRMIMKSGHGECEDCSDKCLMKRLEDLEDIGRSENIFHLMNMRISYRWCFDTT